MENKKKSNVKTYIIFTVVLVCSLFAGIFFSVFAKEIDRVQLELFLDKVNSVLIYFVPSLHILVNIFALLVALVTYKKAKISIKNWNGEDDSIEKTEAKIGIAMAISSVSLYLGFLFYGVSSYYVFCYDVFRGSLCLIVVAVFIWTLIDTLVMQKKFVNLIKKINPEKKGDILSFKFNKEWMESCDEAEKITIYKCGYRAYKVGSLASLVIWLIAFLGMLEFDIGVFPLLCVSIIILALTLAYSIESFRIEYRGKK